VQPDFSKRIGRFGQLTTQPDAQNVFEAKGTIGHPQAIYKSILSG
jgi:hypothetical protein